MFAVVFMIVWVASIVVASSTKVQEWVLYKMDDKLREAIERSSYYQL